MGTQRMTWALLSSGTQVARSLRFNTKALGQASGVLFRRLPTFLSTAKEMGAKFRARPAQEVGC